MNIIILTYIFYPEPIAMTSITEDLAIYLSKEHNVTVVTSRPCRPYGYNLPTEIDRPSWPFKREILNTYIHPKSEFLGRMRENVSFGKAAVKYIKQHYRDIDVIYMNVFPLFAQKMVIKAAKKFGIATVNHIEDIYPEPFCRKLSVFGKILYRLLLPIDRWILRNGTYSVVIGDKIKEYLVKSRNADAKRVKVVYNWQDESRFHREYARNTTDKFTFMYVGSISKAADLHNVLDAFVMAKLNNARLVFAGSGNERSSLVAHAKQNPDIPVEFIDAPYGSVAKIQSEADVLVLPLLKGVSERAVPSKLPAYLFSHRPVLACVESGSDVANILRNGNCGWVVQPEHPEELAKMMHKITQMSRKDLQIFGEQGYVYSQNHLTREVNLHLLASLVIAANKKA